MRRKRQVEYGEEMFKGNYLEVLGNPDVVIPYNELRKLVEAPYRRRLQSERRSVTHHFTIAGTHDGYVIVGLYPDGTPGEVFVNMTKQGSTVHGLIDCWAILFSMALQYGVPLLTLVEKFSGTRFEPMGFSGQELGEATSVIDYIVRWLHIKFNMGGIDVPTFESLSSVPRKS